MDIINGAAALVEGFGKEPPDQGTCQHRADICTGRLSGVPCPHNHRGAVSLTVKVAQAVHAMRQLKLERKLNVEGESALGVCKVCGCDLVTKVFYDPVTIHNHTTDETLSKFPGFCWIKKEIEQIKHPTPQCNT